MKDAEKKKRSVAAGGSEIISVGFLCIGTVAKWRGGQEKKKDTRRGKAGGKSEERIDQVNGIHVCASNYFCCSHGRLWSGTVHRARNSDAVAI